MNFVDNGRMQNSQCSKSLLILNEDCLRLICDRLDIPSQISLFFTCKHLRFIINDIYRTSKKVSITPALWNYFNENEKDCQAFFKSIGENVTSLALYNICGLRHHLFKYMYLPKITTLKLTFSRYVYNHNELKKEFFAFIKSMSNNLKEMVLLGIHGNLFCAISVLPFPELTKCTIGANDYDTSQSIPNFLPNETHIAIKNDFRGHNIWLLKNLEELNLINCYAFKNDYLTQVFLKLKLRKFNFQPFDGNSSCFFNNKIYFGHIDKCQTIEELGVKYRYLDDLVSELPKLKNLRCLTFTPRDFCVCTFRRKSSLLSIAEFCGQRMDTLIFKNIKFDGFIEEYLAFLEHMTNLRCIIFIKSFPNNDLLQKVAHAAGDSLQEFRHVKSLTERDINEGLKQILTHCRNLRVFDISSSKVHKKFIREAIEIVRHRDQVVPLVIRCHKTEITKQLLEDLPKTDRVKIALNFEPYKNISSETIHCEWNIN